MNKAQFKIGQLVMINYGTRCELGIIEQVVPIQKKTYLIQQGYPPVGTPQGETITQYQYLIHTTKGETPSMIREHDLKVIKNEKSFIILRRKLDTSSIDDTPARALACELLNHMNSMVMESYGEPLFNDYSNSEDGEEPSTEGLIGGLYYTCEDELTEIINKYKP
jgi:hypothetical protein